MSKLVQKGGTNSITSSKSPLYVGYSLGSSGTCNFSGGSLSATSEYVGNSGTDTFNQSGGTNSITSSTRGLYLGNSGSGSYDLSGQGVLSAYSEDVGFSGTGTFTQTGGTNTLSGALSGPGGLAKLGDGALTLAGSNTYTGPTTINQGTLLVDGWLTNSAVTVSGGTLGGTGYLSSVMVNAGGHLAPGDAMGILSISGNLVLATSAAMDFELDWPGDGYDQLDVSGLATLGGTLNVNLASGFMLSAGQSFDLISGATTGSFAQVNLPSLSGGLQWDTSNLYTTGTIAVVPEPSTFVLLGVGAIGLLGYAWRKRIARRQTSMK